MHQWRLTRRTACLRAALMGAAWLAAASSVAAQPNGSVDAQGIEDVEGPDGALGPDASPPSPREAAEQLTLPELEARMDRHRRHRRAYLYGLLASGVVLTAGVAVALNTVCVIGCSERDLTVPRLGAGLVVLGAAGVLVTGLASLVHGGSMRAFRRRIARLSLEPTVSRSSLGGQLRLTW